MGMGSIEREVHFSTKKASFQIELALLLKKEEALIDSALFYKTPFEEEITLFFGNRLSDIR